LRETLGKEVKEMAIDVGRSETSTAAAETEAKAPTDEARGVPRWVDPACCPEVPNPWGFNGVTMAVLELRLVYGLTNEEAATKLRNPNYLLSSVTSRVGSVVQPALKKSGKLSCAI